MLIRIVLCVAVCGAPHSAFADEQAASQPTTYETVIRSERIAAPWRDGTSTITLTREDLREIPGGTTRSFNDLIATQPGVVRDNYGAVHVRGNFSGLQLRVDGVQLPPAIQDRLQQLLDPQIIEEARVIVGGLPAEFGEDVGGVIDMKTRHAAVPVEGEAQLTYGTYNHVQGQANVGGALGDFSYLVAGMVQTTERGLDPEAAEMILHDRLNEGRVFMKLDDRLSSHDRLELLALYAESHYQIPIDPTLLRLSGSATRGPDRYGNEPPDFVPFNSNPTEFEREAFGALSWFHDFSTGAQLQITPFVHFQNSVLSCDVANQLGVTADPGSRCSDVNHQVVQGGLQVTQSLTIGRQHFRAGLLLDGQHSKVGYTAFQRDDDGGGADDALTLGGVDDIDTWLGGIYLQDRITFGKLTLSPGVRLDLMHAQLDGSNTEKWLVGPSYRLGAAYAFTDNLVLHAFLGHLWQPPSFDAPAAARILGLVPANAAVPFDLTGEDDDYAEIGFTARLFHRWSISLTPWGRLSQHTIDDQEVGDTALTADYNYAHGRAYGIELATQWALARYLSGFANLGYQVSEGEGITSSRYLFSPQQVAFTGYQATDNAQKWTASVGADLRDATAATHLSGLMTYGSGLRTGPTNSATLPPSVIFDVSLRHRFDFGWRLKPEVAIDVQNLFNVIYALRISTGSLAGTAYGSLRQVGVRVIVPFGDD